MCDNCKDAPGVMRMLGLSDAAPDAITRAAKRLRCYYECVTSDSDIFADDPESDELDVDDWDDDDELGLPRY